MKFRAYDKQEKKLYKPDTMGELFYLFALTMDGRLGRFNEDLGKYETCDPDRYVVEFSTCKKDIKGNDIFYGDIVWAWCNPSGLTGRVQKRKCEVKPCKIFGGIELIILDYEKGEKWKTGRTDHSKGLEIIGNIHDGGADGKT